MEKPLYRHIKIRKRRQPIEDSSVKLEVRAAPAKVQEKPVEKEFKYDSETHMFDKDLNSSFSEEDLIVNLNFPQGSAENPYKNNEGMLGFRIKDLETVSLVHGIIDKNMQGSLSKVKLKVYYDEKENCYVTYVAGKNVPVSPCCHATIFIKIYEDSGGRFLCSQKHCYIKHIGNFYVQALLARELFENNVKMLDYDSKAIFGQIKNGAFKNSCFRNAVSVVEKPRRNSNFARKVVRKNEGLNKTSSPKFGINSKTIRCPKDYFPVLLNPIKQILHKKIIA